VDFYRQTGELIFGTRLKRISEKFLTDVSKVYKVLDIPFEVSWFPIFYLLNQKGALSVTEIARELQITHSAVSQWVNVLQKKKLIKFINDANDRRKRLVDFTAKGSRLIPTLEPIWESMTKAMQNLMAEGKDSVNLLDALSQLEDSVEKESLYARIIREVRKTQLGDITVSPYVPADEGPFKNLILSWLIQNNEATVLDSDLINQPEVKIQEEDALILMAKSQEASIGTIVVQVADGRAEIVYLVVDESWQRRQIGKKLVQETVQNLKNRQVRHIRVQFDRRMSHVIKLFKDAGFLLQSVTSDEAHRESDGGTLNMDLHLT
jgi:DNA-binding MarR family transcriptional regulator/GNAT superfamily N-acetyltransferase